MSVWFVSGKVSTTICLKKNWSAPKKKSLKKVKSRVRFAPSPPHLPWHTLPTETASKWMTEGIQKGLSRPFFQVSVPKLKRENSNTSVHLHLQLRPSATALCGTFTRLGWKQLRHQKRNSWILHNSLYLLYLFTARLTRCFAALCGRCDADPLSDTYAHSHTHAAVTWARVKGQVYFHSCLRNELFGGPSGLRLANVSNRACVCVCADADAHMCEPRLWSAACVWVQVR